MGLQPAVGSLSLQYRAPRDHLVAGCRAQCGEPCNSRVVSVMIRCHKLGRIAELPHARAPKAPRRDASFSGEGSAVVVGGFSTMSLSIRLKRVDRIYRPGVGVLC